MQERVGHVVDFQAIMKRGFKGSANQGLRVQ